VLNGLYWTILPLVPALCGLALVARVVRRGTGDASDTALPCLAVFHALVALRFQIPVYLYYTVGLSLAGWLWLLGRRTWLVGGIAVALSVVGVVYHAGEPFRSVEGMIGGERRPLVRSDLLPRLGVRLDRDDLETYRSLIDLIRRTTRPEDPIFALPYDPELYFLSERRNPFSFSLLPLHLAEQHDADAVIHTLLERPPALVIHNRTDKYNEPSVGPIVEAVQRHYRLLAAVGPFDVYRPAAAAVAD
jgi:hypothetical protein